MNRKTFDIYFSYEEIVYVKEEIKTDEVRTF